MTTVECPPKHGRNLSDSERKVALASWYRVVASDGSTIAYVPDNVTAKEIAAWLNLLQQ